MNTFYIIPSDEDAMHHGVLGMKWGVRRYQPYSVVPRGSGKSGKEIGDAANYRKRNYQHSVKIVDGNAKDANDIYNTLTTYEKHRVMNTHTKPLKEYIKPEEHKYLLDSILLKVGDIPVSSFDIWNQENGEAAVSLITRNDPQYRNKGYAYELAKKGKEFFDNNPSLQKISWSARVDNVASRKLAEKLGFDLVDENDKWAYYEIKKDQNKKNKRVK